MLGPLLAASVAGAALALSLPERSAFGQQLAAGPFGDLAVVCASLLVPALVAAFTVVPSLVAVCVGLALELPGGPSSGVALAIATIAGIPAGAVVGRRWPGGCARRGLGARSPSPAARSRGLRPASPRAGVRSGLWRRSAGRSAARCRDGLRSCSERAPPWCSASPGSGSRPRVRRSGCLVPRAEDTGSRRVVPGVADPVGEWPRIPVAVAALVSRRDDVRLATVGAVGFGTAGSAVAVARAACRLQPVSCSRRRRHCSARCSAPWPHAASFCRGAGCGSVGLEGRRRSGAPPASSGSSARCCPWRWSARSQRSRRA